LVLEQPLTFDLVLATLGIAGASKLRTALVGASDSLLSSLKDFVFSSSSPQDSSSKLASAFG
jgi:hypothetical protein